jgi:epoxyqueuosine reductase
MSDPARAAAAKDRIRAWGDEIGLSAVGIAPAATPPTAGRLFEWLDRGYQASMGYLARDPRARIDPQAILPGCASVICAALDYDRGPDPAAGDPRLARISRYAWGEDYHVVLKEKLDALAARIREAFPEVRTRVAVDTSPVFERAFAAEAGLGWIGKNTLVIDPRRGSYFFLGEIFTTLDLPRDPPVVDHCGSCRSCLDACPTGAIVEPFWLDAGRCLAYWNIEHRGEVDPEFHASMENWIFGCDVCQEVCPWNLEAPPGAEPRFAPRPGLLGRPVTEWFRREDGELRALLRGSAMERARVHGLRRNIAIAADNAPD